MTKDTHPKLKSTNIVYKGFFDFQEDIFIDHKGIERPYNYLVAKADGVAVLPEIEENIFLLTCEYRYPIHKKIIGCPGGRVDNNEDPLVAGKRELLEETGYEASTWIPLDFFYPFPSASDQKVFLYLARDLKKIATPQLDPLENIETKIISLDELYHLDFSVHPIDGVLPTALFFRQFIKQSH